MTSYGFAFEKVQCHSSMQQASSLLGSYFRIIQRSIDASQTQFCDRPQKAGKGFCTLRFVVDQLWACWLLLLFVVVHLLVGDAHLRIR